MERRPVMKVQSIRLELDYIGEYEITEDDVRSDLKTIMKDQGYRGITSISLEVDAERVDGIIAHVIIDL
jgi:hypothetical protein